MKIIETHTLLEREYSRYKTRDFETKNGRSGSWEYIERTSDTRAVVINAYHPEFVVLIKQLRIPMNCYCLEFPAGLIDQGESAENCAVRELLEETGFTGKVTSISPLLCTSPGLTSETVYMVNMQITGQQGLQQLDDSEDIEVVLLPRENISDALKEYLKQNPEVVIDSKVWMAYILNPK